MTPLSTLSVYSDAPLLQGNFFLASLQWLFWLFFHPSAWRSHLRRVAPTLPVDFCLLQVTRADWRRWAFWRLLFMTFFIWPIGMGVVLTAVLLAFRMPAQNIFLGVIIGLMVGLIASFSVSLVGNLSSSVPIGCAVALSVGLGGSIAFGSTSSLAANGNFSFDLIASTILGLAGGLAGGLAFGVNAGLASTTDDPNKAVSVSRQISGVIIGVLIGSVAGLLATTVAGGWLTAVALALPFTLAVSWRTRHWPTGIITGLALFGLSLLMGDLLNQNNNANSLNGLLTLFIIMSALFALPYILAERIAGSAAGAVAGALGTSSGFFLFIATNNSYWPIFLFSLAGLLLGLTLAWWRPVIFYPFLIAWNFLLMRVDEQRLPQHHATWLRWHSAFWDEYQALPLIGLDAHLLLVMAYDPIEANAAIEYLSTSRQRWAAQMTQIELDARQLEQYQTAPDIARANESLAAGELAGPASALLRSLSRISQDVSAALRQESAYNQRLSLSAVEDRLDGLLRELTRSNEPYAIRFRSIAAQWRQTIAQHILQLTAEAELRQEIDSPYIIGVPLTDKQEIFVGRTHISAHIEQLLLDRRRPPLFLYGQRRVGKTSLLNNLGRLLPSTIVPLFVDLQGPASRAKDEAGFLYNMARAMSHSAKQQRDFALPLLERELLEEDPFTIFDEWLDAVEEALGEYTALLLLDEFEVLDGAFERERLDATAVLGMLRHLIQHRTKFKVLLSGSHTLEEFHRWSSYLINVQMIHIGHLQADEARQLIEKPVQDFALRYEKAASERILSLTRGHPFLVQLLCAEVVALKNEQEPHQRRLAQLADVETAVALALSHGSFFFADMRQNQVSPEGLKVLLWLAHQGEGATATDADLEALGFDAPTLAQAIAQLQQREIIEPTPTGWRFQVELMRRWFAA